MLPSALPGRGAGRGSIVLALAAVELVVYGLIPPISSKRLLDPLRPEAWMPASEIGTGRRGSAESRSDRVRFIPPMRTPCHASGMRRKSRGEGRHVIANTIQDERGTPAAAPADPARIDDPNRSGKGDRVTLSAGQLLINQRIAQAGVRDANALIRRLETGLSGTDLWPGTLTAADLG